MRIFHNKISVHVSSRFFFLCAVSVLFLPLKWLLGFAVAVTVHELSHYLALRMQKIPIYSVKISDCGVNIATEILTRKQEFLAAIAGPTGGLLFMLATHRLPYISVCALIQSLYNLLPIGNSDGARALTCLLDRYQNKRGIYLFCETVVHLALTAFLICFLLVSSNMWVRLALILIVYRLWHQKYLAKKRKG